MTISLKKINIWKVLFVYLILQPIINNYIKIGSLISYSDEIIAVVLAVLAIIKSMQQLTLLRFERIMLISFVTFELIGLISGFASKDIWPVAFVGQMYFPVLRPLKRYSLPASGWLMTRLLYAVVRSVVMQSFTYVLKLL